MKNVTILDQAALSALDMINAKLNSFSEFTQSIMAATLQASNDPKTGLTVAQRVQLQRKALLWADLTTLLSQATAKLSQIFLDEGRLLANATFSVSSTEAQAADEKQAELPIQEAAEKEGGQ